MEQVSNNSTTNYTDKVGEIDVTIRKIVTTRNVTVFITFRKGEATVCNFVYDKTGNYSTASMKDFSSLSAQDVSDIYSKITELLGSLIFEES